MSLPCTGLTVPATKAAVETVGTDVKHCRLRCAVVEDMLHGALLAALHQAFPVQLVLLLQQWV